MINKNYKEVCLMAKYQLNQIFYYTGDDYNSPGLFKITAVKESDEHFPTRYDLKELAGERGFHGTFEASISNKYNAKAKLIDARAYDDYILKRHEKYMKRYGI
jgi:hypothetical protein